MHEYDAIPQPPFAETERFVYDVTNRVAAESGR
jgi:hypothetical protein